MFTTTFYDRNGERRMGELVAYYRVSAQRQGQSGLGMEPIRRLTPSKFDPWLPPHERAATKPQGLMS
jgi:hypothetical protein